MNLEDRINKSSKSFFSQCRDYALKLGMVLTLLAAPSCAPSINSIIATFPDNIPGASVRKLSVPNSKYCLIHIRDRHLNNDLSNVEEYKEVQDDIYQTLQFLKNKYDIKGVYLEGVTPEKMGLITSIVNKLKTMPKEKIHKEYALNATFRMASEGNIKIYPAENSDLIKLTMAYKKFSQPISKLEENYHRSPKTRYFLALNDKREDALLAKIAGKQSYFVVIVYGQSHVWAYLKEPSINLILQGSTQEFSIEFFRDGENDRFSIDDNIREWNKEHPYALFSFIEITPNSLNKP